MQHAQISRSQPPVHESLGICVCGFIVTALNDDVDEGADGGSIFEQLMEQFPQYESIRQRL